MAFPRYFFALCAVLVFFVVGGIHAQVESESIEPSSAELEVLKNYLAKEYGHSAQERGLVSKILKILFLVEEKLQIVFYVLRWFYEDSQAN